MIELGPGTGPVTEALVERGIDPARLVLVEFNPTFCRLLRTRYPDGDRDPGRCLSPAAVARPDCCSEPAAAVVSGLPLIDQAVRTRMRLIDEAFGLMAPDAPFVQFTYAMVPPIPKRSRGRGAGLRADLAEPAAGARVGLSQELTIRRQFVMLGSSDSRAYDPA